MAYRVQQYKAMLSKMDLTRLHLLIMHNRSIQATFEYVKAHPHAVHKRDVYSATPLDVAIMLGRSQRYLEALVAMGCETFLSDDVRTALAPHYRRLGLPALHLRGVGMERRRRMLQSVALAECEAELAQQELSLPSPLLSSSSA